MNTRALFTGLFLLVLLGFSRPAQADDVIFAVVEYGSLLSAEQLTSGFARVNLTKLAGEDKVRGGSDEVRGGRVLLFQRSPLLKGKVRQSTYIGANSAEITYVHDGSSIKVDLVLEEGLSGPITKTTRREMDGQGPVTVGRPVVLRVTQASGSNSRSGKSGYRSTEFERTRVLLMQVAR